MTKRLISRSDRTIKNEEYVPSRWYRFEILTPNSAILRGSFAMNDTRFKQRSRGNQAAPCSVVAIVFGRLFEPKDWTRNFVDRIVEYGDKLFRTSATKNRVNPGVYLTTSLVYPEFYIDDYKCLVCNTEESSVYGNLFSGSIGCPELIEGLQRFFKLHDSGVITAQGTSVAVWRNPVAGYLYYDPSGCGPDGTRSKEGVACAMRFSIIEELTDMYLVNLDRRYDSRYSIDRVSVIRVNLINRGVSYTVNRDNHLVVDKNILRALSPADVEENKVYCPKEDKTRAAAIHREPLTITISNYHVKLATEPLISLKSLDTYYDMEVNVPSTFKELPDKMAILHGWTHEASETYKGKGAQNVANCVVAIAMKKVHPVRTWLRPRLDEILAHGDALYSQVKADKSTIRTMTAADLDDTRIKIEDKPMIVNVDLLTVVGTISSTIPGVLSLGQALEEFYLVNVDGIVECSSMALAVWTQDDYYYTFDPRQCDATGTRIIADEKGKSAKGKKEEAGTSEKRIRGKCCVMRFPALEPLVSVFMKNIDRAKKNDRFIIRAVTVIDDAPGVGVWEEFHPAEAGKTWILRGGISNRDESFESSAGLQGIAMPIVALINAKETPPDKWTKDTIDQAVKDGDEYYNWCVPSEEDNLPLSNVRKTLYVKNRRVKIELAESRIVGDPSGDASNLSRGIAQFFANSEYGIVEANNLSVAIWKFDQQQRDKTKMTFYYLYDANPRDNVGRRNSQIEQSKACVIRAVDPAELARLIENNIVGGPARNDFAIHEVNVISIGEPMSVDEIETDKATPVKPDLNFYTEIDEGIGCLNGSFDQANDIIFRQQTRDKQQAANALVALAMRKLYNPRLWYRELIDDILKIGDRVTLKSMKNLPAAEEGESRDYLLPIEIDDEFDIGVNRATVTIEEEQVTGDMSELTKKLEEFFEDNTMGVFRQDKTMLPIWKEGDLYFTMDPRGNPKDAVATVLWFTGIPSLASRLLLPGGDFIIDSVTLSNAYESRANEAERLPKTTSGEDLWHRFPKKSSGIWVLEGNVSINDERFDRNNRNKQTAAIAIMAIIFSKAYEPRQWSTEVLDEVIITGDKLHSQCLERLGSTPRITEITKELFLSNRRIDLTIEDCVEAGNMLGGKPPKIQDLQSGFVKFFKRHTAGALTVSDNVNIAVWMYGDFYYSLVPFESLVVGPTGRPRVVRLGNLQLASEYLGEIIGKYGGDYVITSIDVIDWDKSPSWKLGPAVRPSNLPPLNAYRRLNEGEARAILRGGIHQGSDIFPEKIRNRQAAANCVVALGMSVVKNPATWTKKTMDEILAIGANVHRETSEARGKVKLKGSEIVRVFRVGVNVIIADVEESTISGPIADAPPEPEAKKKKPPKAKKAKKGKAKRMPLPPAAPIYLEDGLPKFLENNRAGILVTGRYMAAIWRDQGVYFVYDPRSRDDRGSPTDAGASCVMWFARIEPLFALVFGNIDEDEKYGRYVISRVIVRTTLIEALPCPAGFRPILECHVPTIPVESTNKRRSQLDVEIITEYRIVDEGFAVLRGTRHINDRRFKSRGLQSTAVAAVAIVVALLHAPSTWTGELVDAILKYGDLLHTDTARAVRTGARNLSPNELPRSFVIADFLANIHVHRHTTAGILHSYDLLQSLDLFFRNNSTGILHTGSIAMAVMQHYGKFYLFDPLARDQLGRTSYDGSACVLKCRTIERLAWHFVTNCNYKVPCLYTLNAVNVLALRFFPHTGISTVF